MKKCVFRTKLNSHENYYLKATLVMPNVIEALERLQKDDECWEPWGGSKHNYAALMNQDVKCNIISAEDTDEPQTPWGEFTVVEEKKDENGNFIPYRTQTGTV